MKVLLVNPPDTHSFRCGFGNTPRLHQFSPPLGLMYIKSYLKQNLAEAEVRLFNFQVPRRPSMDDFISFLKLFSPDVVGITVMTAFWYDTCEVVRTIKNVFPDVKVVGGGPHMWIYPEISIRSGGFDAIVQGYGEAVFVELLKNLRQGVGWEEIKGILYVESDGVIVKNPPGKKLLNIDEIPFPDRSDFQPEDYRSIENYARPTVVALASRGCPYHCTFCNNHDRIFRPRRADLVVNELLECRQMGYQAVMFYDDVFTCSREHVASLCEEMRRRNLDMPWICQTRVDCIDHDLVRQMVAAGCVRIQMGVESGSQSILDTIDKQITLEQCRKAFTLCRKAGVETVAYFIIGLPGDNIINIKQTFAFAEELDADYVICTPLVPIPGTPIFETARNDAGFDSEGYRRYISNPEPNYELPVYSMGIAPDKTIRLINSFYRRYYTNPRRIIRYMKNMKGLRDLWIKAKVGRQIIFNR